jgi:hypothetical protein
MTLDLEHALECTSLVRARSIHLHTALSISFGKTTVLWSSGMSVSILLIVQEFKVQNVVVSYNRLDITTMAHPSIVQY